MQKVWLLLAGIVLVVSQASGLVIAGSAQAHAEPKPPSASDWKWLAGTTWIVPPKGVLAYQLQGNGAPTACALPGEPAITPCLPTTTPPTLVALRDQTVYHISGYRSGYFWGTMVVALGAPGVATTYGCTSLLGPISPDGDLLIINGTLVQGARPVQSGGNGKMVKRNGRWTMMNVKSGPYTHWAYMVQSKPGDAFYRRLPFVGISVDEMLAKCPNYGPVLPK